MGRVADIIKRPLIMKRILIILLAVVMCLPVRADSDGKQVLGNLFRAGMQAVQNTLKHEQEDKEEPGEAKGSSSDSPEAFSRVLIDSLEKSFSGIKERYKKEGRSYARELGDIVAERIVRSSRVQSVLFTLRMICWAVIAYLILVTILLLVSLQRLRANDRRILELLREIRQKEEKEEKEDAL